MWWTILLFAAGSFIISCVAGWWFTKYKIWTIEIFQRVGTFDEQPNGHTNAGDSKQVPKTNEKVPGKDVRLDVDSESVNKKRSSATSSLKPLKEVVNVELHTIGTYSRCVVLDSERSREAGIGSTLGQSCDANAWSDF